MAPPRRAAPVRVPVDVLLVAPRDPARFAGRLLASDGIFEAEADLTAEQLADPVAWADLEAQLVAEVERRRAEAAD